MANRDSAMMTLADAFTFRTAAADSNDNLFLLSSCDEIEAQNVEHTCAFLIENDMLVDKLIVRWQSSGIVNLGPGKFLVFGNEGQYLIYDGGQYHEGDLWNECNGKFDYGVMRAGGTSSGQIWWVGFDGRGAIRDVRGHWTQATNGLSGDYEGVVPSLDGSVVAYGWKGNISCLHDAEWVTIGAPTNVILTNGCVGPDGKVILVGQDGIVLRGSEETWDIIVDEETNQDFWGVASFEGKLYVSTMQFIYEIEDDETLTLVQFDDEIPETYCHLVAAEKKMWSIGNKSLFQFADGLWRNIVLPDPR